MSLQKANNNRIYYTEETAHLFNPDDDLRGRKFGRLTAVQFQERKENSIKELQELREYIAMTMLKNGFISHENYNIGNY